MAFRRRRRFRGYRRFVGRVRRRVRRIGSRMF